MWLLHRLGLAAATTVTLLSSSAAATEPRCFPADFLFGSATASYQVEGAWNEDGRTPSIWDDFCREQPGFECANVADDFYHRYADDIKLMMETGLQSFRFSVSWSRVMNWDPEARRMRPNAPGLVFYHALLDKLVESGISPLLTIYHWDLPTELHNELTPQGWLNPEIIDHFVEYSTLLYNEFGDKVDFWTTFNEPLSFVVYGYNTGLHPPGFHDSPTLVYEVAHNVLLSHAYSVQRFRELKSSGVVQPKARIGIVLNANQFYPLRKNNSEDAEAAERAMNFEFGWWLLPLTSGDYPPVMRERVGKRLPRFTAEQTALVKGSYDVLVLNHYFARSVTPCDSEVSNTPCSSLHVGFGQDKGVDDTHIVPGSRPGLQDSQGNNYCKSYTAYPPGYLDTIKWMHSKDPSAEILLTENGWCGNDEVENLDQLWFFQSYIEQVYKAVVEEKIPVIGYTAWSFRKSPKQVNASFGSATAMRSRSRTSRGTRQQHRTAPSTRRRSRRLAQQAPGPVVVEQQTQDAQLGEREYPPAEPINLAIDTLPSRRIQLTLAFILNPDPVDAELAVPPSLDATAPAYPNDTFDEDYEFGFPDDAQLNGSVVVTGDTLNDETQSHGSSAGRVESGQLRRTGRTNKWIGGYKYTRIRKTSTKIYYRCSHYRSMECRGKCHFDFRLESYCNFVSHTCGTSAVPREGNLTGPCVNQNVREAMKRSVDTLAVTTTANRVVIWDIVRAKFYGNPSTVIAISGLEWKQC